MMIPILDTLFGVQESLENFPGASILGVIHGVSLSKNETMAFLPEKIFFRDFGGVQLTRKLHKPVWKLNLDDSTYFWYSHCEEFPQ